MAMHLWMILWLSAVSKTKPDVRKLRAPDGLSVQARALLKQKMESHGLGMMRLVADVVLLSYRDVEVAANEIAEQPGLARPREDAPNTLNDQLPTMFFDLQDQLRARAKSLADAAKRENDAEMSAAFTRVTETCVACHSAYLNSGRRESKPAAP